MKPILLITFLVFIFLACDNYKSKAMLAKIDLATIEVAEIKKGLYDTFSVRLSDQQTLKFAEYINTTKGATLVKAIPAYWIFVKLKTDSIKIYKVRDELIGWGDSYINIADSTYFKNIYEKNNKTRHHISIR